MTESTMEEAAGLYYSIKEAKNDVIILKKKINRQKEIINTDEVSLKSAEEKLESLREELSKL